MAQNSINDMVLAEHRRNVWMICPADETKLDQVLVPEYWSHIATQLRPMDRIEICPEDGSYWAELLVLSAARGWAKVKVLQSVDLHDAELSDMDDGPIAVPVWKGPAKRWCVTRISDGEIIVANLNTKEDAIREAKAYQVKVA